MAYATVHGPRVIAIWKRRSGNTPPRSAPVAPMQSAGQPVVNRQTNPDPSIVGVPPNGKLITTTLTGAQKNENAERATQSNADASTVGTANAHSWIAFGRQACPTERGDGRLLVLALQG